MGLDGWLDEVEARLGFLPGVRDQARALWGGEADAAQTAARWREALPGVYSDVEVDPASVEAILERLVLPALEVNPVGGTGDVGAVVDALVGAAVEDLGEWFCEVNGVAVERVALGLAALGRGDPRGEGELAEGLGGIRRGAALIDSLPSHPALSAALHQADAPRREAVASRQAAERVAEVSRLRQALQAAMGSGALTDPRRADEVRELVAALEAKVLALQASTAEGQGD